MINPDLRALLVCPLCRGELEDHPDGLVCHKGHPDALLFPVEDGVPMMVRELARPVPDAP